MRFSEPMGNVPQSCWWSLTSEGYFTGTVAEIFE
jgi:hypothetical protein